MALFFSWISAHAQWQPCNVQLFNMWISLLYPFVLTILSYIMYQNKLLEYIRLVQCTSNCMTSMHCVKGKILLGKSISRVLVPLGTQNFPPSGPTMVGPQVDVAGARNVILPRGAKNTATPLNEIKDVWKLFWKESQSLANHFLRGWS